MSIGDFHNEIKFHMCQNQLKAICFIESNNASINHKQDGTIWLKLQSTNTCMGGVPMGATLQGSAWMGEV